MYVDGVGSYSAGAESAIDARVDMSAGKHTLLVRAWDESGNYGDQSVTVTAKDLKPTVTISAPTNHANVGTPVNIRASSSPTAGQSIRGWKIYVDGATAYSAGSITSIDANVTMHVGSHSVVISAWDTSGAYGDQTLSLTVSSKPAVAVSTPAPGVNVISPRKFRLQPLPAAVIGLRDGPFTWTASRSIRLEAALQLTRTCPRQPERTRS